MLNGSDPEVSGAVPTKRKPFEESGIGLADEHGGHRLNTRSFQPRSDEFAIINIVSGGMGANVA